MNYCIQKKVILILIFKRDSVIALYLAGKPQVALVRELQHLNVNKSFVSRTMKLAMLHCVQKADEKKKR